MRRNPAQDHSKHWEKDIDIRRISRLMIRALYIQCGVFLTVRPSGANVVGKGKEEKN
jgi:hypothetical protein